MRRRRSIFRADPNGSPDINTTPLIDVMLVMLVMFVITIPPPTHKVDVTLPAGPAPFEVRDENRVSIDTSDIIRWNGNAVDLAELGNDLGDAIDHLLFIGDIHRDCHGLAAGVTQFLGGRFRGVEVEVGDGDAAAGLGVDLGDALADAAGGTGDDADLSIQCRFHVYS